MCLQRHQSKLGWRQKEMRYATGRHHSRSHDDIPTVCQVFSYIIQSSQCHRRGMGGVSCSVNVGMRTLKVLRTMCHMCGRAARLGRVDCPLPHPFQGPPVRVRVPGTWGCCWYQITLNTQNGKKWINSDLSFLSFLGT